jgi:hypothetical protein
VYESHQPVGGLTKAKEEVRENLLPLSLFQLGYQSSPLLGLEFTSLVFLVLRPPDLD